MDKIRKLLITGLLVIHASAISPSIGTTPDAEPVTSDASPDRPAVDSVSYQEMLPPLLLAAASNTHSAARIGSDGHIRVTTDTGNDDTFQLTINSANSQLSMTLHWSDYMPELTGLF